MKVLKDTQITQLGGQGQTAVKADFPTIMNKVFVNFLSNQLLELSIIGKKLSIMRFTT
jgi:hypothetical protein